MLSTPPPPTTSVVRVCESFFAFVWYVLPPQVGLGDSHGPHRTSASTCYQPMRKPPRTRTTLRHQDSTEILMRCVLCRVMQCREMQCRSMVFLHTGCSGLHPSTPSDIRPVQYGCVAVFLLCRDTGRADVATCDHCGESVDTNSVAAWSHLPSNFDVCEVCFMNRSARDPWEVSEGELVGKPTASVPVAPPPPLLRPAPRVRIYREE